nr:unnamed protein product [Digitaria exilis]
MRLIGERSFSAKRLNLSPAAAPNHASTHPKFTQPRRGNLTTSKQICLLPEIQSKGVQVGGSNLVEIRDHEQGVDELSRADAQHQQIGVNRQFTTPDG